MPRRRFRRAERSLLRAPRDNRETRAREWRRPLRATHAEQLGPPAAVVFSAQAIRPVRATLRLNSRGRLTIPADIRRALAIEEGGSLIVEATPERLLLRPALLFPLDACDARDAHAALAVTDPDPRLLKPRRRRAPR